MLSTYTKSKTLTHKASDTQHILCTTVVSTACGEGTGVAFITAYGGLSAVSPDRSSDGKFLLDSLDIRIQDALERFPTTRLEGVPSTCSLLIQTVRLTLEQWGFKINE